MVLRFNADEVFRMAMQIERNGGAFYRKAAENHEEGRELLLKLAKQEDQHLALFETMHRELSDRERESTVFDPNNESMIYLKAMADGHVFDLAESSPESILAGARDLNDIITIALQAEKDTIAFFVGMKDVVPERLGRDRLDLLIREEMGHIRWLNEHRP